MNVKRCSLTRARGLQDMSWEVQDWLKSVVHPTYDVMGMTNLPAASAEV